MTREWKPGDVAVNAAHGYRGIWVSAQHFCSHHVGDAHWHNQSGHADGPDDIRRPLVVIDPEDREQVERLRRAILGPLATAQSLDSIADALRSLLAPPKPDEPTGLGAVVADVGDEYVHFGNGCWIKAVPNAGMYQRGWTDMTAAVKVLSSGVS